MMSQSTEYFLAKDLYALKTQLSTASTCEEDFGIEFDAAVSMIKEQLGLTSSSSESAPDWDTEIGGLSKAKEKVREMFGVTQKYSIFFKGHRTTQGLLLYGPPGCGKTFCAAAIAKKFNINFISVKGPELLNKYIGASEQNVRELFEKA